MHRTLDRVRAEFTEMPGLRLTAAQVARLCGVDASICQAALDAMVDANFLRRAADGRYARVISDVIPRPRPIKAAPTTRAKEHSSRRHA